jgi:hypothetical protein
MHLFASRADVVDRDEDKTVPSEVLHTTFRTFVSRPIAAD